MKRVSILATLLLALSSFSMENYEVQTAQEKFKILTGGIERSIYEAMPEMTGAGYDALKLLSAAYDAKAFSNSGDLMAPHREKLIHTWGVTANVQVTMLPDTHSQLTGLFESGSRHAILRLSLAEPPEPNHYIPGFALKMLRDNFPSANVFAMPSLDALYDGNLFAEIITPLYRYRPLQ